AAKPTSQTVENRTSRKRPGHDHKSGATNGKPGETLLMLLLEDIRVAGVKTPTYEAGPRDRGEAVVFVHGNPGPSDDWERLAPQVARFSRVVAMDLPGYGRA